MTVMRPDASRATQGIDDALRALARAFSAVQLYLPNNPQRGQRLLEARQAFAALWPEEGEVALEVREDAFVVDERIVYQEGERATDGLPWLLYRDGIRGLTFMPGFEERELDAFLALVQGARHASSDEDDLVTMLWVADFEHLRYRFLDSGGGGGTLVSSTHADAAPSVTLPIRGDGDASDGDASDAASPSRFLRMEEFDGALYFLDAHEITALQAELAQAYADDPRRPVLDSLIDLLAVGLPEEGVREALQALERMLVEMLTAGDYGLAAETLHKAAECARLPDVSAPVTEGLAALPAHVSEPSAIAQLLLAIDDGQRTPPVSVLEALFQELRPSALEPLVRWLGAAGASPARTAIERASLRLAEANVTELARLLEHADVGVVRGALRLAGQLTSPVIVPGLTRLLRNDELRMRMDAVNALANIASPGALQALERAMDDPDREVRVAIYRTFVQRRHVGALPRLLAALRSRETRSRDLGEKMAVFEAFGTLSGDAGVAELDGILNSRGFIGSKEPPEFRACAARALGLVGTPAALASLQKASDSKDVVVRSAVLRALREHA